MAFLPLISICTSCISGHELYIDAFSKIQRKKFMALIHVKCICTSCILSRELFIIILFDPVAQMTMLAQ